jgi:envelope integrity protein B
MIARIFVSTLALAASAAAVRAEPAASLAPHRAGYEITLIDDYGVPHGGQVPVAAAGVIAYEFTGSRCDGYASNFRQYTQLQRSEGDPISSDIHAVTFEDGEAKRMRFQIDSTTAGGEPTPIAGSAIRADGGDTTVALSKPSAATMDIGKDILFPTEHVERIIARAKDGGGPMEARVYDGSDTGKKVFQTLTVIGKEAATPSPDANDAPSLSKIRRWPVTVSYFDEKASDAPPEYVLSYDLYENGVSGSLKLDYGSFALSAKLKRLELLPIPTCAK